MSFTASNPCSGLFSARLPTRFILVALLSSLLDCTDKMHREPPQYLDRLPYVVKTSTWDSALPSPVTLAEETRPCLAAPTPSQVEVDVTLPPQPLLTFAIGVKKLPPLVEPPSSPSEPKEEVEHKVVRKTRFIVRAGESEPTEEIFRREIHPARNERWLDQVVNLRRFAGKRVRLRFETSVSGDAGNPRGSPQLLGFFAEPVVHNRASFSKGRAVVLISIDTLRRDHVSVYGYPRPTTPSLENLAGDAVVFHDAVSTSSWTLPAHGSLFTSLYPSVHGAVNVRTRLRTGLPSLPEILRQGGFLTQAIVTQIYLSDRYGLDQGFDRLSWYQEGRAQKVTDRAVRFLQAKGDEDFFLFLHYFDPHFHYDPPPPYDRVFDPGYDGSITGNYWEFRENGPETLSRRDLDHVRALYDGEILYTDHHLQRFFQEMKRLGIYEKSLIVVTSDHGEEFLDHGDWGHSAKLYDELVRIPLLIKLPKSEAAGLQVEQQVSLLDVAPTILDVLEIPVPSSFQGKSLLSVLRGKKDDNFQGVWSEVGTENESTMHYKASFRSGARGRKLIFRKGTERATPGMEIYDLARDPLETQNLGTGDDEAVARARQQTKAFLAWVAERRGATPTELPVELDADQTEKLRALGYLQER